MMNSMTPQAGQAPGSAADAVCTLAAPTDGSSWVIYGISWSFSAAPTAGGITIAWTGGAMTYAVVAGGVGQLTFQEPLRFPANTAVVITAVNGGVTPTVYCTARTRT